VDTEFEVGTVIQSQQILDLPLNWRDVTDKTFR
jgi:hypothetical protein